MIFSHDWMFQNILVEQSFRTNLIVPQIERHKSEMRSSRQIIFHLAGKDPSLTLTLSLSFSLSLSVTH